MKQLIANYSFNKASKTVTFTDFSTIRLDSIFIVVNATSNTIIYNFADPTLGGAVATNVLTVAFNTSSMNNSDKLLIVYDCKSGDPIYDPSPLLPTGASTSAKQPTLGTAGTASADVLTVQGIASMTALKVDGSAITQPVSGTVTANAGTNLNTSALALDATLTGGTQKAITRGGAKGSTTAADVTSTASGANHQPLDVAIYDGSGSQITSFGGGGTQYAEGATAATATGTVALGKNGTTVKSLLTDSSGNLRVDLSQTSANATAVKVDGSAVTQPVSGTVSSRAQDGSGNAITSTSGALDINIKSGGGSGFSVVDESAWTAATSAFIPTGGVFNDSAAVLTTGQEGTARLTNNRGLHSNLRNAAGTEIGTSSNPVQVSLANTATNATAVKVDGSAVTQPVSGTVTANAGTNLNTSALALESGGNLATLAGGITASKYQSNTAQIAGTAVSVNNGTVDAGTQRVTIASDSNGQIKLATGANTIGALAANQSVNTAQIAGTTTDTNSGNKSAGTQRVVLATDQPALTNALKVDGSAVTQPVSGTVTVNAGTGLALDATLTGGTQQTKITDGTNIGSVLKSDGTAAGQNAQITTGTGYTTSTVTLNVGTPATQWFDLLNYPWISVEILTNTAPSTLTFQTSGDASQTNIRGMTLIDSGSASIAYAGTTSSTNATLHGPRTGRYFRISSNASGGNTVTLVFTFYTTGATQTMGVGAAQQGTWTVQPGNTANTTPWLIQPTAATTGGATPYQLISAATTNATNVKASAGTIYALLITNTSASERFFKLYDKASSPTVGTDTPLQTYQLPGNANGSGVTLNIPVGMLFATGIAFAITGAAAVADTTAIGASDVIVNLVYK